MLTIVNILKLLQIKSKPPVNSSDKVGTATFEDKSLVGEGYLPNQGMPSMELVAGKEVKKSFFLKVWWNHFVNFVNEKLLIITVELLLGFFLLPPSLQKD